MYKKMIKRIIKKVKEFYYTSSSERFIKYLVSGEAVRKPIRIVNS